MTQRRLDELLAAAGLAPISLARAQQQGANDAASTAQWAGVVKALPGIAGTLVDTGQKAAADDAATAGRAIAAQHIGDVGDNVTIPTEGPVDESGNGPAPYVDKSKYAQTPGAFGTKAADQLDQMAAGSWNPFAKSAFDDAKGTVATQIANNVQANREKAAALARQQSQDALNTQKTGAEIAASNASAAKATADVGDIAAQQAGREQATKKAARDQAINAAISPALAGMSTLAQINESHPEFGADELSAAYSAGKAKQDASKAEIGTKNAQSAQGYAAAEKDRAEAEKARREPAGGKLPAEAQMALATTDATMSRLAHVAGLKANFDASNPGLGQGVANAINDKLRSLGADDPQRTQLIEAVKNAWLEWRKDVAGVRWNPELANMEENVFVKAADNPQTFSGLLSNMWNDAATKHNAILGTAQSIGQNTGTLANAPMLGNDAKPVAPTLDYGAFR